MAGRITGTTHKRSEHINSSGRLGDSALIFKCARCSMTWQQFRAIAIPPQLLYYYHIFKLLLHHYIITFIFLLLLHYYYIIIVYYIL